MIGSLGVFWVLFTSQWSASDSQKSGNPRGIGIDRAHLYHPSPDGTWTCLDGSKAIPFSHINDDYCDCKDSSDEPGTAACPNSTYTCLNHPHHAQDIPGWKVNDGVCDVECCDGSDEWSGRVLCENRCEQLAEEERLEREEKVLDQSVGFARRKEYIERARQFIIQKRQDLQDAQHDLEVVGVDEQDLQALVHRLDTIKREEEDALAQRKIKSILPPLSLSFLFSFLFM